MRLFIASSLGLATGIFGFAAGAALPGSLWTAALVGGFAAVLVTWWVYSSHLLPVDESAASRGLKIVSGVATVVALVQLLRLVVFIVDPTRVVCSFMPASRWEIEHSCLSAYYVSAKAAATVPDIYDDSLFTMPDDDPTRIRNPRMIGPFKIDVFEYPPPFLLLTRGLLLLAPEFLDHRMLWFGLSGMVVLLAFVVVARFLSPHAGTRALLLSPLVWVALPTISTFQKGNVQVLVIAASMLAMVLFERRHFAAGGGLLAFVAMGKIYPGMLVIYLVAQRRWRALAWTIAAGLTFLSLSLLDTGWPPYVAFLRHLPAILGGESFPAFRNPAAMANNFSIPGLVFKLKLLGVPGMSFAVSKAVGWAYTLVVIAVTVVLGRRAVGDDRKPLVWMAILLLATLRSPFLPPAYAVFPPLWLLTLLAATKAPTARAIALLLAAWAVLNVYWAQDWPVDPRLLVIAVVVPQAVTVALSVLAIRRVVASVPGSPSPRST
ncbi:MAG: DUF2029 domain-containing protein [Acidobacteriia bacterium]|nr:DUF2029 domain-containing protein [Terriglobia bacterium]